MQGALPRELIRSSATPLVYAALAIMQRDRQGRVAGEPQERQSSLSLKRWCSGCDPNGLRFGACAERADAHGSHRARGCGAPVAEAPTRAVVWPWRLRTESSLNDDARIAANALAARSGMSRRMPRYHGDGANRSGVVLITLIRSPLRLPQHTWTASSSPRLIRCMTV